MSRNPAVRAMNLWSRKLHRWGAIATAIPVLVILCSGLLLQVKKQVPWVQPPEQRGSEREPRIGLDRLLAAAAGVPEAGVQSWSDIDRIDLRVGKGIAKILCVNGWEVQVDTATGEVLQVAYRRSDLIESIHDGSFFHDHAKLWIFLPSGAVLLALWVTGIYLWVLPIWAKRAGRQRRAALREA